MNDIFEQADGETPVEWIERLLQTLAVRLVWFAAAMFLLGFVMGNLG